MPSEPPKPSEVLVANLRTFRDRRGWSQQELADRLAEHGVPWVRSTVAKVESQMRSVDVDEAVALAYVLGIPLVSLLIPRGGREQMRVTPTTVKAAWDVQGWMRGEHPDGGTHPGDEPTDDVDRFYADACTDTEAAGERFLPGLRDLRSDAVVALAIAGATEVTERRVDVIEFLAERLDDIGADAKALAQRARRMAKAEGKSRGIH